MGRNKALAKFTSLHPVVQALLSLGLLTVLFFLQRITLVTNRNPSFGEKVLNFFNTTISIALILFATIWFLEVIFLIVRAIRREPLAMNTAISQPTVYFLGSFVAAWCLYAEDTINMALIRYPFAYFAHAFAWIILFAGIVILMISAVKLILYINIKEENRRAL